MLRSMRQGGVTKALMGVVVVLIILAFALDFRSGGGGLNPQCVVEVASQCVSPKDFNSSYLIGSLGRSDLQDDEDRQIAFKKQIVEGLIERELLLAEAGRLGLGLSEEELFKEILAGRVRISLPAREILRDPMVRLLPFKDDKSDKVDPEIYKRRVLNYTRLSTRDFEEKERSEVIAARMRDLVLSQTRVSEAEAYDVYEREQSRATARIALADTQWFQRFATDSSDEAAREHLAANAEAIDKEWESVKDKWKAGCPLVWEIRIDVTQNKEDAQKAIEETLERIKKDKENFQTVARDVSDAASAVVGGQLGCLHEGYGPTHKTLLDAAAKLKEGQVSDIIETVQGFHLLKLVGTLEEKDIDSVGKLTLARSAAVQAQAQKKAEQFATRLIKLLGEGHDIDGSVAELTAESVFVGSAKDKARDLLLDVAKDAQSRPRVDISSPFTLLGNPIPNAEGDVSPAKLAFSLEEPGQVYDKPIKTGNGYAVLQLKEKTVATKEEFQESKTQLLGQLKRVKGAQALATYLARLRAEAGENIRIDTRFYGEQADDEPNQDG